MFAKLKLPNEYLYMWDMEQFTAFIEYYTKNEEKALNKGKPTSSIAYSDDNMEEF